MYASIRGASVERTIELPQTAFRSFDRDIAKIGTGLLGGKAECLASAAEAFHRASVNAGPFDAEIVVPHMHVIATDFFDIFMSQNGFVPSELDRLSDSDIRRIFDDATLPGRLSAELSVMLEKHREPLAVRSSGLLETTLYQDGSVPYAVRFLANRNEMISIRLDALKRAIKSVWASLFLSRTRAALAARGKTVADEKTAVIIQNLFGRRIGDFFAPDISGKVISADRRWGYQMERAPFVEASMGIPKCFGSVQAEESPRRGEGPFAVDLNAESSGSGVCGLVSIEGVETVSSNTIHRSDDLGPMDPSVLMQVPVEMLTSVGERIIGGPAEVRFAVRKTSDLGVSAAVLTVRPASRL